MNLNDLTVGQVKEIAALANGLRACNPGSQPSPGPERAVVVCTDKRGVFFGYATDISGDRIVLRRARMAVSWTSVIKGVMGLAGPGPNSDCRISGVTPAIELRGITAVMECSEQAVKAWEAGPWIKS